mmetsp:Transcript_144479/g.462976  ORF Transcript_144479/g.462976 Transcript_144479/m.462976 type:complete len:241 (+) Transcript_144479:976-1698(+)
MRTITNPTVDQQLLTNRQRWGRIHLIQNHDVEGRMVNFHQGLHIRCQLKGVECMTQRNDPCPHIVKSRSSQQFETLLQHVCLPASGFADQDDWQDAPRVPAEANYSPKNFPHHAQRVQRVRVRMTARFGRCFFFELEVEEVGSESAQHVLIRDMLTLLLLNFGDQRIKTLETLLLLLLLLRLLVKRSAKDVGHQRHGWNLNSECATDLNDQLFLDVSLCSSCLHRAWCYQILAAHTESTQ